MIYKYIKHNLSETKHLLRSKIGGRLRYPAIFALIILLVLVPLAYLTLIKPKGAEAAWFDDSWAYRKAISIPSHTSAEINVYVTVPTFDATDTGKFQADCGDLRFTKQNGELLPYYVVDCDATANIHVLFDTLPAGASTYYLYYGNPSASNGFEAADFSNAASGLGTQTLAAEEKSAGPVAYWKFDEGYGGTANDSTQNANTGSLGVGSSAPTWVTEDQCISGKCLKFDGVNDYVEVPDNSSLDFGTGEFSVSLWIKVLAADIDSTWHNVISKKQGYNNSDVGWMAWLDFRVQGAIQLRVNDGTGDADNTPASQQNLISTIQDSKFHFITWVVNSDNTVTFYLDGVSQGSQSFTKTGSLSNSLALRIGNSQGNSTGISAIEDEIKIYNYTRSAAQVKTDYTAGLAHTSSVKGVSASLGGSDDNLAALNNGLVGYWKQDEATWSGTLNEVVDSSGNGNHGQAQGATGGKAYPTGAKFGNGGYFDGVDDYVSASLNGTTYTEFTYGFWFNTTTISGTTGILQWANALSSGGPMVYVRRSTSNIDIYNSGAYSSSIPISANTWYRFDATYKDGVTKLYLNGLLMTTFTRTLTSTYQNNGTTIYAGNGYHGYFSGYLDDIRIYNRALSPEEVRQLYDWAPGPVGYWKLDEKSGISAYDSSTYAGSGTISGASWTQGKFGSALNHDGSSNYIYAQIGSWLGVSSRAWTASAWFNSPDSGGPIFGVTSSPPGGGWNMPFLSLSSGGLLFGYSWGGGQISCSTSFGQWHHGEVVYDPSNGLKLYLDGVLCNSSANTGYSASGATNYWTTYIGGSKPSNVPSYFKGKIDDVKIYNYARTSKQIVEDMNAGHPAPGSPVGSAVGYWKFDEGYGTVANNSGSAGTTLNGTLGVGTSAPSWTNQGKFGKALSFDGAGDYVGITHNLGSTVKSVSAWFKLNSMPTGTPGGIVLATASSTSGPTGWDKLLRVTTAGKIEFYFNDGSGRNATGTTTLTPGVWYYAAGVTEGSRTVVYLNGKEDGSYASVSTYTTGNYAIIDFDDTAYALTQDISGLIDEVKVYNYALTADEIKLDYNRGSAMVLGTLSDTSGLTGGSVASQSASAAYCIPGDTASCNPPVGEWKMDEKTGSYAYDTSGNGNTGTWNGTGNHWALGKIGAAGQFNGSSDFLNAGTFTPIDGKSAVTGEAWIYPTTISPANQEVFVKGTNSLLIRVDSGGNLVVCVNNTNCLGTGSSTIVANQWQHIAFSWDTTTDTTYIYVNGRLITSGQEATTTINTGTMYIGSWAGSSEYFNGYIDQVKIYDYARTPAQVAYDYNRGGPVGWWKMDECQGGTANDASGNANNGTITIGATGTQAVLGTCSVGVGSTAAWGNGSVGKYNSSLNFDGTDDYVTAGTNPITGTSPFTLSAWMKMGSHSTYGLGAYIGTAVSGQSAWIGWTAAAQVGTSNSIGGGFYGRNYGSGINDNNWHHVILSFNGGSNGTALLYVDGVQKVNDTYTPSLASTSVMMGKANTGTAYWYNGQIDDVKIFNYALTAAQIKTLYNQGAAVQFAPITGSPQ